MLNVTVLGMEFPEWLELGLFLLWVAEMLAFAFMFRKLEGRPRPWTAGASASEHAAKKGVEF